MQTMMQIVKLLKHSLFNNPIKKSVALTKTDISLDGLDSQISHITVSDNNLIATGFQCGTLVIWKIDTESQEFIHIKKIKAHSSCLQCIAFHPDGNIISCSTNCLRIWDPMTGFLLHDLLSIGYIHELDFLSDGSIISGTLEGVITIWKKEIFYVPTILPDIGTNHFVQLKVISDRIFMPVYDTMTYHTWVFDSDQNVWLSHDHNISGFVGFDSKMYNVSDIMTISSHRYSHQNWIDIIDTNMNKNLLTLELSDLSCYQIMENDECQKYRISTGSFLGDIKIWDVKRCDDKMSQQLVFTCRPSGLIAPLTIHYGFYKICEIKYLSQRKIVVSMPDAIKIISLESIDENNTNRSKIEFTENQVCERLFGINAIERMHVISGTVFFIDHVKTMYLWKI